MHRIRELSDAHAIGTGFQAYRVERLKQVVELVLLHSAGGTIRA